MDWYPITRDAFTYGITVVILIVVLIDERVFWYESMVMVLCYLLYIVLMVVNPRVERWAHRTKNRVRSKIFPDKIQEEEDGSFHHRRKSSAAQQHPANESTPLHVPSVARQVQCGCAIMIRFQSCIQYHLNLDLNQKKII